MRQAVILAGGKGSRLASRLNGAPKPLIGVDGQPLLERQLRTLAGHGVNEAVVLVNHRADAIEAFCAGISIRGLKVVIRLDDKGARGTAGAVWDAVDLLADRFLVLYGDTLLDVDLDRFWRAHETAWREQGALASLFLHPNDHPDDSDLVDMDDAGRVRAFHSKPHAPDAFHRNLVNAALYVMEKSLLDAVEVGEGIVDFGKDLFPRALGADAPLHGYVTFEYIKDIGTPERLDRAVADLRSGKVARCRLGTLQKAVFLDRDGTLNRPAGHVAKPEALELIDGAGEAVARLNRAEFRCVLTTNQPVLARGECSPEEFERIRAKLETLLGREGGFLDASYVCPHYPDSGFPGEVAALKIRCDCRKPAGGLLKRAIADLSIDPAVSWMVGDSAADVGAARAVGVRSVLVRTGGVVATMLDVEPDYEVGDLTAAADFILSGHKVARDALAEAAARVVPGMLVKIGGQSRAGKSVVASALREMLAERDMEVAHLRMDRWILPAERRPIDARAKDCFDWAGLERTLGKWRAGATLSAELPSYNPRGGPLALGARLQVGSEAVLILDGTFALSLEPPEGRPRLGVYVDCDEAVRRARFEAEYARRGRAPAAIAELYAARRVEEFGSVEATRAQSDLVIAFSY